jgi:hypothetical protein
MALRLPEYKINPDTLLASLPSHGHERNCFVGRLMLVVEHGEYPTLRPVSTLAGPAGVLRLLSQELRRNAISHQSRHLVLGYRAAVQPPLCTYGM